MAEISINTLDAGKVVPLQAGERRLSGGFAAKIEKVSEELSGAKFTVVPWKSTPEYSITVTKPGYLYFLKGSKQDIEELDADYEYRKEAITGSYLAGAHRIQVEQDQQFKIRGYELSIIAGDIVLK